MIYVFRQAASESARELAEAIHRNCRRLRNLRDAHFGHGVRRGDTIVCWGEALGNANGATVLNGAPVLSKYNAALKLREAGVNTVEASRVRPQPVQLPTPIDPAVALFEAAKELTEDFSGLPQVSRDRPFRDGVTELLNAIRQLSETVEQPAPQAPPPQPVGDWVGRMNAHHGGNDLLHVPTTPDYWAKKEAFVKEIRIHCFKGKSIRAGQKVPREGVQPHPWIRSFDAGWKIAYDGFASRRAQRKLAAAAVTALGLDFGAVDMGIKADGSLCVLEVNRAPGLEGGTTEAYANAIERYLQAGE
jgi:hypothetical protein